MSTSIYTGFMAGLFVVCIVSLASKKRRKYKAVYDERQKAIQGEAYKYGFFTLMCTSALACMLYDMHLTDLFDMFFYEFSAMIISAMVFAGYAIFKDAYLGLNSKVFPSVVIMLVAGVGATFCGVMGMLESEDITELQQGLIIFPASALLIGISAMLGIKQLINKNSDKSED